jgi:hypothetical protein
MVYFSINDLIQALLNKSIIELDMKLAADVREDILQFREQHLKRSI